MAKQPGSSVTRLWTPGWKTFRNAGRLLRSRRRPHIVILGYHRVSERSSDPFDLTVTARELDQHLGVLTLHARPVTLGQAVEELARGAIVPRTVVVTFDDGYDDTLTVTLPLLQRHGVPATVFVTTGNPGKPFWWDTLASTLLEASRLPDRLAIELAGAPHSFPTSNREQLVRQVADLLRPLDAGLRENALAALVRRADPRPTATPRALREAEIRQLGADPLVEIGGHTITHPLLAPLSPDRQRLEILGNREQLEATVGAPVRFFSYPHGSFNNVTRLILREGGFAAACCSEPDVVTTRSDLFALPRLWVDGKRKLDFPGWITRWLAADD